MALCILALGSEKELLRIMNKARPYVDEILVAYTPVDEVKIHDCPYGATIIMSDFSGDFAKERNQLADLAKSDYVLWWDTDEDFSQEFLENLKAYTLFGSNTGTLCYRFPRENLPDLSGYPDYQVRLYQREHCEWRRPVHEIVIHKPSGKPADQVDCLTVDIPITHFAGRLHKRVSRFKRNVHTIAGCLCQFCAAWKDSGLMLEDLIKECDDLVYEVTNRYADQTPLGAKLAKGEKK